MNSAPLGIPGVTRLSHCGFGLQSILNAHVDVVNSVQMTGRHTCCLAALPSGLLRANCNPRTFDSKAEELAGVGGQEEDVEGRKDGKGGEKRPVRKQARERSE